MEPLRGGKLVGRIPAEVEEIWDGAEIKRTPAEWAFRWVWDHPEVTALLSGMNEATHIIENTRIAGEAYPKTNRTKMQYFLITSGLVGGVSSYASLCRGCGKCERVCPQHLPIRKHLKVVARDLQYPAMKQLVWFVQSVTKGINFFKK